MCWGAGGGVICISFIFKEGMQLKNETFLFDLKNREEVNKELMNHIEQNCLAAILLEFLAKMHAFCQRHQR